jgi:hypothetical protein
MAVNLGICEMLVCDIDGICKCDSLARVVILESIRTIARGVFLACPRSRTSHSGLFVLLEWDSRVPTDHQPAPIRQPFEHRLRQVGRFYDCDSRSRTEMLPFIERTSPNIPHVCRIRDGRSYQCDLWTQFIQCTPLERDSRVSGGNLELHILQIHGDHSSDLRRGQPPHNVQWISQLRYHVPQRDSAARTDQRKPRMPRML